MVMARYGQFYKRGTIVANSHLLPRQQSPYKMEATLDGENLILQEADSYLED